MSCQGFLSINTRLGNGAQVVGDDTPANPALHAIFTVIATAVQLVATFQPTDPSFNAGPPIAAAPKPPLAFIRLAPRRLATRLREHHPANAVLVGDPLIRFGRNLAITNQQERRTAEAADVVIQARHQLGCIVWIPRQYDIPT